MTTNRQNVDAMDALQPISNHQGFSGRRRMSVFCSGLLATVLLTAMSSTANAARCMRGSHFNLSVEGPWQRYMTVTQGRHCRVSLLTGNKRYPALSGWYFERLNVVQSPSHGSVRTQGLSYYVYAAPSNYTGKDQFTVRACGHSGSQAGCSNFLVDVTIVARNG